MKTLLFPLLLFLLFCGSCTQSAHTLPVIDLNNATGSEELKLSQLAENIRILPLETQEDNILPDDRSYFWVSDKYIVVIHDKSIELFDSNGKYIRKLARAGKGPDEYQYLLSHTVDENRDLFYYVHNGDREHIYVINLKEEKPIQKIHVPCMPLQLKMAGENLLCVPNPYAKELSTELVLLDPKGEILDSLPGRPEAKKRTFSLISSLLPCNEQETYYQYEDTIFRLNFKQPQPFATLQYLNKFNAETNLQGHGHKIILKTPDYLIVGLQNIDMKKNENMISVKTTSESTFRVNTRDFKPVKISSFHIDPLQWDEKEFPGFQQVNNKIFWKISAYRLKEILQTQREKGITIAPELEQLDGQLTEESNPVLIVGDLK